jgi:hypothetical protein
MNEVSKFLFILWPSSVKFPDEVLKGVVTVTAFYGVRADVGEVDAFIRAFVVLCRFDAFHAFMLAGFERVVKGACADVKYATFAAGGLTFYSKVAVVHQLSNAKSRPPELPRTAIVSR